MDCTRRTENCVVGVSTNYYSKSHSFTDPYMLQAAITILKDLLERMGLQINAAKTKVLLGEPTQPIHLMSNQAYARRITGQGETYKERMRALVTCPHCPTVMQRASLPQHIMSIHNMFYKPDRRQQFHDMVSADPQTYIIDVPRKHCFQALYQIACTNQIHFPT
jgi:hypothetical protein